MLIEQLNGIEIPGFVFRFEIERAPLGIYRAEDSIQTHVGNKIVEIIDGELAITRKS